MEQGLTQLLKMNNQAKQYFDSLPKNVQETLHQSGSQISSDNELRNCACNLMGENHAESQV